MRRWTTPIIALAVTVAACGDDGGTAPSTAGEPSATTSTTSAPASTVAPAPTEGTTAPGSAAPSSTSSTTSTVGRPPLPTGAAAAPDFDLVLADGSTFSLRDADRPIYLVFWAEW